MNPFNALCKLASDEGWCWNLHCTTCRHGHFRYALAELASGKNPNASDWVVRFQRTDYSEILDQWPRKYSESQKERILNICADADIGQIALECKFPDWLGYLGLVLAHMQSESDAYKLLSREWAIQLKEIVSDDSEIWYQLNQIATSNYLLGLEDLQYVESDIKNSIR